MSSRSDEVEQTFGLIADQLVNGIVHRYELEAIIEELSGLLDLVPQEDEEGDDEEGDDEEGDDEDGDDEDEG